MEHHLECHSSQEPKFRMEVEGYYRRPLYRQTREGQLIADHSEGTLLNRRGEWGQNLPPKLEIVVEDKLVRPQPQKRKIVSKCDSGEGGLVHQGPETGQTHIRLDLSEQSNVSIDTIRVREEQIQFDDTCTNRQQLLLTHDNLALQTAQGVVSNTSDTELKLTHGMKSIIYHFYVKQTQNDNNFSPSSVQRANKIIKLEGSSVGQASSQISSKEHINTMSTSSPAVSDLISCKFDKAGGE